MGGVGSGNWYRYDKKTTAGETHSGLSSIKRYARMSLSSSTEGKDNGGESMNVVMLLYRTDLPYGVKTHPWHVRTNRFPKPLEQLQLLLLPEHHVASGHTLKLKDEFGLLTPKLLLDLLGHPIEPCGDSLLVSAREPDARALGDFCLYGDRSVGQAQLRYASNHVLLIFHVARGSEKERKRYGVPQPVSIRDEGLFWKILFEYFYSWLTIYLVDDVPLRARHYALPTYWDQAVAVSPGGLRLAREQRVGDPTEDDFVVAVLVGSLQSRNKVVEVLRKPIGEHEQADGV